MLRAPCQDRVMCGSASSFWGVMGFVESPIAEARADTQVVAGSPSSRLRAAYSGRFRNVDDAAIDTVPGLAVTSERFMTNCSHWPGMAATFADILAVPSRGTVNWRLMLTSSSDRSSEWGSVRDRSKK